MAGGPFTLIGYGFSHSFGEAADTMTHGAFALAIVAPDRSSGSPASTGSIESWSPARARFASLTRLDRLVDVAGSAARGDAGGLPPERVGCLRSVSSSCCRASEV